MAHIDTLNRERLTELLFNHEGAAVVDVWGPQCQPCIALSPTFEDLASSYSALATFYKLEAPRNRMACVDLRVLSLPTFLFYRAGAEVARLSGSISAEQLIAWIEQHIENQEGGDQTS